MIAASIIFVASYVVIASGRIPLAVAAMVGASVMVLLRVLDGHEALEHIDLNVILLLGGMMTLAEIIGRTGAFDWIAVRSAQLVKGNGFGLICLLSLFTAVASAFLDNVTTVVLMVPITLTLCKSLKLDPIPFLLAEVFASNIGGTATLVGDPPNIIIASVADIGFLEFMLNVAPVTLICMVPFFGLIYLWFRKDLNVDPSLQAQMLERNPGDEIRDLPLLKKGAAVLGLTILGFLVHDLIDVEPAFIAVAGAAALMLISRLDPHDVLVRLEWSALTFFVGLFILVGGLVETGVTGELQELLVDLAGDSSSVLAVFLIWFGGAASSIVDNIPYTATAVEVITKIVADQGVEGTNPLWWALALGADLGGNYTSVGASANVIVISLARAAGHEISFVRFLKYGVVISTVTLAISTGYMLLRYY